jgi:L-fuculose-phosphate aldolase
MYASVFAVLGKEIPAVVYEAMVLGLKTGVIPVAPYGRPGSMELAESVIEPVKISDALLLARHGALAVDEKDIESAYLKANYIEEFAEIYYHVLTVTKGTEPPVFGPEELRAWGYPEEIKFPQ